MRLENIIVTGADGLKGWTGKCSLAPVTLIVGPNGSGKTSRLLAILAGLRGVAETPTDPVREYLGPDTPRATVDLTFDGVRFSRSLSESSRTAAGKRADGAAEQICGPHLVRWDLADFAAGNDAARQKLLDRVCDLGAAGWSVERVQRELGDGDAVAALLVAVPLKGRLEVWAAAAQAWAREEYTRVNAEQRRLTAEADALAISDVEASPDTLPQLDAEIAPLREQLARARASVADQDRAAAAHRRNAQMVVAEKANIARLEAEVARNGAPAELPDLASVQAASAGARAAEDQAVARVRELQTQVREARAALDAVRRLSGLGEAVCQHCGQADPLGKRDEIEEGERTVRDLERQVAEAEDEADLERTMARAAHEALGEAGRAHKDAELARSNGDLIAAARERLAQLEANTIELPEVAAAPADLERQVAALQARRDRVVRGQERERQFQRAVANRDAAIERFNAVKAVGGVLKAMREAMAAAAFLPLQREATAITGPVLDGQVVFRSASEFGLQRGDRLVTWWALSDGERAVTAAALSYAFARLAGAPWRAVLLDGAEVIDPSRLQVLLGELERRCRLGDLDNAVVACRADQQPAVPAGVEVVALTAATAALEVA